MLAWFGLLWGRPMHARSVAVLYALLLACRHPQSMLITLPSPPPLSPCPLQEAALPAVSHALAVRAALASADYQAFFRLYASAPALGRALMDIYVPKLRFDALTVVVKAFKPSVPVPFLAGMLGFVAPAARAARAAPGMHAPAGGSPAAGGSSASPAAAAGGEGIGKSESQNAEGESGAAAAAAAEPANGAGPTPSDTAAAAAGAAVLAEPDSSAAAAAAAGGGAAEGPAGGGSSGPPPGCMETYFVGDYAGQVGAGCMWGWGRIVPDSLPCAACSAATV